MKLRTKFMLICLSISIFPLILAIGVQSKYTFDALEKSVFSKISAVQKLKSNNLQDYFKKTVSDIEFFASTGYIKDLHETLLWHFSSYEPSIVVSFDARGETYNIIWDDQSGTSIDYIKTYEHSDLLLINAKNGHVMFSVARKNDLGKFLNKTEFEESAIAKVWKKVTKSQKTLITDFRPYNFIDNAQAMFIGTPVFKKKKMIAVLVFRINSSSIDRILNERTGLGETGETFVVAQDNAGKYSLRNTRKIRGGSIGDPFDDNYIKNGIDESDKIFVGKSKTAVKEIIAHKSLKIQDINWTLFTNIEFTEEFKVVNQIIFILGALTIIIIGLVVALSFYFALDFTHPIIKLTQFIKEVESSSVFSRLIEVKSRDEIGQAGSSLNALMSNFSQSLNFISQIISDIAKGDLTNKFKNDLKGDSEAVQVNINRSIDMLRETIEQVTQISEQVFFGVKEVTTSAQELSLGTSQQAASLEQISSSLNEVNASAKLNSKSSLQAQDFLKETAEIIQQGNGQMENMSESIKRIQKASYEVSKIMKEVDEIAFQTNLLSLNAAVEAARAGKYGKGFAVVAEEVRRLAIRSAESAKSTTELIEKAIQEVSEGVQNTENTQEIFNLVSNQVRQVNDLAADTTKGALQQGTQIDEINKALSQINQIVQKNSAISEESAAAAEQLSAQAMQLQNAMSQFQLTQNLQSDTSNLVIQKQLPI